MATNVVGRRTLLTAGMGALALAGIRVPAAFAEDKRLRMFWWGAKDRADRTFKVNALYSQRNPGVTIDGETLGWGDYWPRLATQAAGRNVPDILQMDYRYIFEYARRGALLPLDQYMPAVLNIADFGKDAIDSGKVDGKVYGVSLGLNSTAVLYSRTAFETAGLKPPSYETSWADYPALFAELTKAANREGFWGSADGGGSETALEVWLRQRGKALYDKDGKLGFDAAEAGEWLAFWDDMRKRKACVPPDVQALDRGSYDSSMIALGKAATAFEHSNLLVTFQTLTKDKMAMTMYPHGGAGVKPGQYLKPSQMLSVYARTKFAQEAARIVNFFVEDPEAAKILSVERGVPASAAMRKLITPELNDLDQQSLVYISQASERVGPLPAPPPNGAGEIQRTLRRINEEVGFARLTPANAGKQFIDEAKSILERG